MSPDNAINERDSLKGQVRFLRSVVIGLIGLLTSVLFEELESLVVPWKVKN